MNRSPIVIVLLTLGVAGARAQTPVRLTLDEAMINADSPTNLHWLINNAKTQAAPAQTTANLASGAATLTRPQQPTAPQDDLSSIKLNLDALG